MPGGVFIEPDTDNKKTEYIMSNNQQDAALKKANRNVALLLAGLAIASLCLAAYGVSKTLAV